MNELNKGKQLLLDDERCHQIRRLFPLIDILRHNNCRNSIYLRTKHELQKGLFRIKAVSQISGKYNLEVLLR